MRHRRFFPAAPLAEMQIPSEGPLTEIGGAIHGVAIRLDEAIASRWSLPLGCAESWSVCKTRRPTDPSEWFSTLSSAIAPCRVKSEMAQTRGHAGL